MREIFDQRNLEADTVRELSLRLAMAVSPIDTTAPSKNKHYVATGTGELHLFVKVMAGAARYFESELAAGRLLSAHNLPHPPIYAHGALSNGARWIAYRWMEMKPLQEGDARLVRDVAALLAQVHKSSLGWSDPKLRTIADPVQTTRTAIHKVANLDGELLKRLERLYPACLDRWTYEACKQSCLLHGDFGLRNVALVERGEVLLFDYEHASIAPPLLEFAKAWDRELADASLRRDFLEHYATISGIDVSAWGGSSFMIRLWAAAGIFPYAKRQRDHEFERHGLAIVCRLEQELLGSQH